jgi:hypothetical protein
MTESQTQDAADLITRLDAALKAARVSASVRIVEVNGEPRLRISSRERGEALRRLNHVVAGVLWEGGVTGRYLETPELQN